MDYFADCAAWGFRRRQGPQSSNVAAPPIHWTARRIRALLEALGRVGPGVETMPSRSQEPRSASSGAGLRALRLVDILRQLPEREIASLVARLGIAVDKAKRIDVPSQVARALLMLPEARDPSQLPGPTRELLYRIAESRGSLLVEALPAPVEPLVASAALSSRAGPRTPSSCCFPSPTCARCAPGKARIRAACARSSPSRARRWPAASRRTTWGAPRRRRWRYRWSRRGRCSAIPRRSRRKWNRSRRSSASCCARSRRSAARWIPRSFWTWSASRCACAAPPVSRPRGAGSGSLWNGAAS